MSEARVVRYIEANQKRFLGELVGWLKIPSISGLPKHRSDVLRAGDHVSRMLGGLGFKTKLLTSKGHPSVYAERIEDPKLPILLIYGHMDVQPVDPLTQWKHPPFDPWLEDGRLYGRGTADDKGQVMIHIKACEALIKMTGGLPLNVKFIIEGEEEVGSPNFEAIVKENRDRLTSTFTVISDTSMVGKGLPTVAYATRGLVYFEVSAEGPKTDLHSGSFGGAVVNPLLALAKVLSGMVDERGRVAIPGFYSGVAALTAKEKRWFSMVKSLGGEIEQVAGVPALGGEKGLGLVERVWARPTFEVHGLSGGFQGPGSKTIIPQNAMAKVSMRLVPGQDPARVAKMFTDHVRRSAPKGVRVSVQEIPGGGPAFIEDVEQPAFRCAGEALKAAFGVEPVFARCGGSIFAPEIFKRYYPKTPVVLMGFGLPGENAHAPNEWLDLDNFQKGIITCADYYGRLA